MFETRGRQSKEVYVDGNLYIAKKPIMHNTSVAVLLPKDWLSAVSNGRELKWLLLDVRDLYIQIKPYFDSLPCGQGGEDD